jgi:hypothetical protein
VAVKEMQEEEKWRRGVRERERERERERLLTRVDNVRTLPYLQVKESL